IQRTLVLGRLLELAGRLVERFALELQLRSAVQPTPNQHCNWKFPANLKLSTRPPEILRGTFLCCEAIRPLLTSYRKRLLVRLSHLCVPLKGPQYGFDDLSATPAGEAE